MIPLQSSRSAILGQLKPLTGYLAGPEVFLSPLIRIEIGVAKRALCRDYGFIGLYPLDQPDIITSDRTGLGHEYSQANMALIRRSDFVIANLTPFRGHSVDPGTAWECGFSHGLNKPVFGYTYGHGTLLDRFIAANEAQYQDGSGEWVDANGHQIENLGLADNLMIPCPLEYLYQGRATNPDPIADLSGFIRCVMAANDYYTKKLVESS